MRQELPLADVVLAGRFEPGQERRYVHLPFAVPPGVRQLHLRYTYTERISSDPTLAGGNTLDIGLFDQRGIAPGSPGFRGWSGSNKLAFTIDRDWATPPYRPGPIEPGTWHVLLGPYKISPRGLDYEVRIWFNSGLPAEERTSLRTGRPRPADVPRAVEPAWVRGDLHCHTLHSDGDSWPSEMLIAAAEAGLDFLGATDHNGINHLGDYGPGGDGLPVVIPGVEVTSYGGHWNAWGVDRWYEFREPWPEAVETAMRAAADGALVSVCHPKPFGPPWEYPEARGYHAIEVWNGAWERLNGAALAFWEAHLRRGERVVALGGSDTHRLRPPFEGLLPARLGQPTTWVQTHGPLTPAAVLDALRAGRCFISASPSGPQLYLWREAGDMRIRAAGAAGAALLLVAESGCVAASPVPTADWSGTLLIPPGARYVRAQLVDAHGAMLALTNPVWVDGG